MNEYQIDLIKELKLLNYFHTRTISRKVKTAFLDVDNVTDSFIDNLISSFNTDERKWFNHFIKQITIQDKRDLIIYINDNYDLINTKPKKVKPKT